MDVFWAVGWFRSLKYPLVRQINERSKFGSSKCQGFLRRNGKGMEPIIYRGLKFAFFAGFR